MGAPFLASGKYLLVAALLCLVTSGIEARLPLRVDGDRFMVRYPIFLMLLCVIMLVLAVLFAVALTDVDRDPALVRAAIWSLIGIPALALAFEVMGKRITLTRDVISRSYFGALSFERRRDHAVRAAYDIGWKAFRVRFTDGSVLTIPIFMRGSAQLAAQLSAEKA